MAFGNATIGDLKKFAGGGGGGGTKDYTQLNNKPSINGVELLAGTEIGKLSGNIKVGISALDNVNITNAVGGQTLLLNAISGKWENGSVSGGLNYTDVTANPTIDLTTVNGIILQCTTGLTDADGTRVNSVVIPACVITEASGYLTGTCQNLSGNGILYMYIKYVLSNNVVTLDTTTKSNVDKIFTF